MIDNLQSISHWGMIDVSHGRWGTLTLHCDAEGSPISHTFETAEEVMPLMVVYYEDRGMLAIMGDHKTGNVTQRVWFPFEEGGAMPVNEFTSGFSVEVSDATRH